MFDDYVNSLREMAAESAEFSINASQLLRLHAAASERTGINVVELGTDRGQSTKAFLNAIEGKGSRLVSIDIVDCSGVGAGDQWTFIQSDSADVENILAKAPFLREGIDVLYIDSLHTVEHVKKEVFGFYKHLNAKALIFFDDVDCYPYRRGQRKDNPAVEIGNREIQSFIIDLFRSNMEQLRLDISYGSTGLARLEKRSPLGSALAEPVRVRERRIRWLSKLLP